MKNSPQSLTICRGIPGSGKSTLAKQLAKANGGVHFEADVFFLTADGIYEYDASRIADAHAWCREMVFHYVAGGRNVVVSNTFTSLKEMVPYFEIGEDFGVFPTVICCQNNFGSIHGVPDETMQKMRNRFVHNIDTFIAERRAIFDDVLLERTV